MAGAVLALSTYVTLWAGLLSFATVSFAAIGAFTSTWVLTNTELGVVTALLAGVVAAAVVGLIAGRLFLRLSSHWLALATVALVLITRVFVVNLGDHTGGSAGEVVPAALTPWQMALLLVVVSAVLFLLKRSKFGAAADATREDPNVAAALGIPVGRVHVLAFGLSGAIGAVGGVMLASRLSFIDPDTFYVDLSMTVLASVVLGGAYHWSGSVIGAAVFTGLPIYISQYIGEGQAIINGLLLLAIIIWLPDGLIDPIRWRRIQAKRRRPEGSAGVGDGRSPSELTDVGAAQ
ncbi:branched-chain amino acid ABC transporter permease [Micromonospora sp. NBC_01638]|uniref:branched-chain amino acid ABC transporter permease n=1 Tax=Micromonospora sp. NBC_01638 TaxID=2975982 RepID=UPI003867E9D7|nr:branched-chain amino acid ABC transporter permease [Micromonospora sp. NBC_01638]